MDAHQLDRRDFLFIGLTALGGLAIGVWIAPRLRPSPSTDSLLPNAFLRIEPSGAVVVVVPRPEMGQGSRTAIAMLVAEELEAEWERIAVEQADLDEQRYGPQYAGGSAVVRTSWAPLRHAGAAARLLLVRAAAEAWSVDATHCVTERGQVRHAASHRVASYESLAATAAALPTPTDVKLKASREFRIIGTSRGGIDVPAIVQGRMTY